MVLCGYDGEFLVTMSTAGSLMQETRGILQRGLEYIGTTVFGTLGLFFIISFIGMLTFGIAELLLSLPAYFDYFSFLTIFGLSLFASQLMARGKWTSDDDDDDEDAEFSNRDKVLVAFSYYNLLIVTATTLAVIAFAAGYPLVATAVALLTGPADIELARRLNVSPLTFVVGMILAVAYLADWLRQPRSGKPQPREIAGISTLERFRRRGNNRLFS